MDYKGLPMILTPNDVMRVLDLSKNQSYNLFRSKKFPSERVGSKHIIPKARFLRWLGEESEGPRSAEAIHATASEKDR